MFRLLKYELRKTLLAKLILLAVTFAAQAVFMFGYWGKNNDALVIGALLLFLIASNGIVLMGILSVITLHRDMNTRQGYMLFMTPNSCYRILGAKVIECGISILIAGAFFLALGLLDFSLVLGKDAYEQIWEMFKTIMETISEQIRLDVPHISALVFGLLASWLCTITTAYLADVLSSSLLYGKKANWLVTIPMFFALNWAISWMLRLIPASVGIIPVLLLQGAAALVLAVIMYMISARMMDKHLSV